MKLSKRLESIVKMVPECNCLADIGTDHGYIPIFAVLKGISKKVIASDIREGPIRVAENNIAKYGFKNKVETRIGPGLCVLTEGEADVIVIAGMGGNVICNILDEGRAVAESADYLIFQPVKYPEVLRKYLILSGFMIIDEDLVKEGYKYYHIIKAMHGNEAPFEKEIYYYIGPKLIEKGHPLLNEYIKTQIKILDDVLQVLSPFEQPQRYNEVMELKKGYEDVIKCL